MNLTEIKNILNNLEELNFELSDGTKIPPHFHITEVGSVTKNFIDCGGTVRTETKISCQLFVAEDFNHRLKPQKLLNIIRLSERKLNLPDVEIEVEYQNDTIGKYALQFDGEKFVLKSTLTACLAEDQCGIPENIITAQTTCTPGSGCC